ncbi:MAG TPA: Mrp/NBP35 family ATP-binding protein [Bacteroidales bacterium]|nr:Mrp/NBP35 family ATP-binding protein [Bacteroidales bacterium]
MKITVELIREKLSALQHPAKEADIVSLGMVQRVSVKENRIEVMLAFEKATDPFMGSIEKAVKNLISELAPETQVVVGSSVLKQPAPKKEPESQPAGIKNIIAVASGKGGVGKSTIAANLAVALAADGYTVGLVDADIFGPSIPKMFGIENAHPDTIEKDGRQMMVPVEKFGIKLLSVGFFVEPDSALVWRGPMASGALKQLITEAEWGNLDYLIVDTPPGTSDIHLTLVQTVAVTGALIVSTPQQVALADARKGINMFRSKGIDVPVLGLVENMSWFTPAELPENKYFIFGKEGCKKLSDELGIPLLGQIPLVQSVCESGDNGRPDIALSHSQLGEAFRNLAAETVKQIEMRNVNIAPTKIVEIKHQ